MVNLGCADKGDLRHKWLFANVSAKEQNDPMRSRFWRTLVFVVMLACLPLQGLAALTMPACQMHNQSSDLQHSMDADQDMDMAHCDHHPASNHQPTKSACEKCVSCFLSLSQAIIPGGTAVTAVSATERFAAPAETVTDSILTSLFRPPITPSAWR